MNMNWNWNWNLKTGLNALTYASKDYKRLHNWADEYNGNVNTKYDQVPNQLLSLKGNGLLTSPNGFGGSAQTLDVIVEKISHPRNGRAPAGAPPNNATSRPSLAVREDGGVVWSSYGAPFAHPVSCLRLCLLQR